MSTVNFETANEQHLRALVVYGKAADSKIYYDAAFTEQVTKADAERYFTINALLVKTTSGYSVPVAITSTKVVTAAKASASSAAECTEWAFKV